MPARTSRRPAQQPSWPPRLSGSLRSSSTCRLLERWVWWHPTPEAEHPCGAGSRSISPRWVLVGWGVLCALPEVIVRVDKEDGNAILPATAASVRGGSSPGEGNCFDDAKLVTASEFTGSHDLHFLTSMSFLEYFTSLLSHQSPSRQLGPFHTGQFVQKHLAND